jgi:hypothetical protein
MCLLIISTLRLPQCGRLYDPEDTACLCSFVATESYRGCCCDPISLCIYWLVFDIALNLMTGKKWHYIGTTAKIDKFLTNLYEDDAGKIKAAIVVVMIAGLNILNALV